MVKISTFSISCNLCLTTRDYLHHLITALVDDDDDPPPPAETVRSPKSAAFPFVAMVMKLILLLYGFPAPSLPPKNNPRVELDAAEPFFCS